MTTPEAAGQRFIAASGPAITMRQIGVILRESLGERGRRVPRRSIPDFALSVGRVLGWKLRTPEEAIIATAESLIKMGLVKA